MGIMLNIWMMQVRQPTTQSNELGKFRLAANDSKRGVLAVVVAGGVGGAEGGQGGVGLEVLVRGAGDLGVVRGYLQQSTVRAGGGCDRGCRWAWTSYRSRKGYNKAMQSLHKIYK